MAASLSASASPSLGDADVIFSGSNSYAGYSIACEGDVDDDGLDDILIGVPYLLDGSDTVGGARLFLGASLGSETEVSLSEADYTFLGTSSSWAGRGVSTAGDVDGDGLDDILISANQDDTADTNAGAVRLYLGSSLGSDSTLYPTDADYTFLGEAGASTHPLGGDYAGSAAQIAQDIDGDGLSDLLIAANNAYAFETSKSHAGRLYLIPADSLGSAETSLADAAHRFMHGSATNLGVQVSGGGDINGDGYGDFLVSAPDWNHAGGSTPAGAGSGMVYIVWGAP